MFSSKSGKKEKLPVYSFLYSPKKKVESGALPPGEEKFYIG